MRRLIINADDLGLTPGCNAGIVRALTRGIVSDTTIMINTDFAKDAVEMVKDHGIGRIGLHLNLTFGVPVSPVGEVPSLVDGDGRFFRKIARSVAELNGWEVELELRAQVAKFLATGLRLTHLDSHHHAHTYPEITATVITLAAELGVPLRQTGAALRDRIRAAGVATTDYFSPDFYDEGVTADNLKKIIGGYGDGVLEIMCHPAEHGPLIYEISDYHACREKELAILTAPELQAFLTENNVRLISFADL